ncbi:MAG: hypothetical protein ACLPSF_13895 [Methylocella sp.]
MPAPQGEGTRRGKHQICRLDAKALAKASAWLEAYRRFWSESFDRPAERLK